MNTARFGSPSQAEARGYMNKVHFGMVACGVLLLSPDVRSQEADPSRQGGGTRPVLRKHENEAGASRGIPWFATWASGQRESQRTGRPILLVAGAPHCAGVSGVW